MSKLTLSMDERLALDSFLPKESDGDTMILSEDIQKLFEITEDEIAKTSFKKEETQTQFGIAVRFNWVKEFEVPMEVELEPAMVVLLKVRAAELNEAKRVNKNILSLYKKVLAL